MGRIAKLTPALLAAAAAGGALWLFGRFVLPLLAPFLAAFALAAASESAVRALVRRGLPRRFAALGPVLLTLALLLALPVLLIGQLSSFSSLFAREAPRLAGAAAERLGELESFLSRYAETLPEELGGMFHATLHTAGDALRALPGTLSARLLAFAAKTAQDGPGILLFAVTFFLGTYFFSASYPEVLAFLRAQLPERLRRRADELAVELRSSFGGWLRAQLILAAVTFFELLVLFWLLGLRLALPLAAVTALIDALPVFGTGAVLVPWAAGELLFSRFGRALALLLGWAISALGRNLLQAKLLGDQIGIHPLLSLLSLYVGWRLWGVGGMIVFPLLAATLQQLGERGVLRLWKTP